MNQRAASSPLASTQRGSSVPNGIVTPRRKNSAFESGTRFSPYNASGSSKKPSGNNPSSAAKTAPTHCKAQNSKVSTPTRTPKITSALLSQRKTSAPGSLISSQINDNLAHLANVSAVKRKISTPAKPSPSGLFHGTPCRSQTVKKKVPCIVAAHPKKSNTPTPAAASCPTASEGQISKDHQNSGSNAALHVAADTKSKKGSSFYDIHPLPTVKEEKKTKSSKGIKKPSGAKPPQETPKESPQGENLPPEAPSTPQISKYQPMDLDRTQSEEFLTPPSTCSFGDDRISNSPKEFFPEKVQLEKTVSDLIKNSEVKKQEIAALKIEINRLKETARERAQPASPTENKVPTFTPADSQNESVTLIQESKEANVEQLESRVESLTSENRLLREHLKQFDISLDSSPLCDQQKEMILNRVSAVSQTTASGGDGSGCVTDREWDNKSSSSISEISVACLQGRIHQMEETHYSTNEELQATLQELDDLKEQLIESHTELQQLQEEKQVILESLTQQTEKLNEARGYNDTLKTMLIQHSENSEDLSQCERTQRLMELLKSVQEDRELINLKQEELDQQLQVSKDTEDHFHREAALIRDRMKILEAMVEDSNNERKSIEGQAIETRELLKASEKEVCRLKFSLQAAKEKNTELEATVISGEKSELADVLERVCQEKETLEKEVSRLHKRLNDLVCENERLKEQMTGLQDDLRITRNNAKTNLDDAEYKRLQLDERRLGLEREVDDLKASIGELQITCQRHLEDKRELKANLSEAQKKLSEMLEQQAKNDRSFAEERAIFNKQLEEWEQFQNDLLTTVRVANDFKTEAQHDLERLQQQNQALKDKLKMLDQELEKYKVSSKLSSSQASSTINTAPSLSSISSAIGGTAADRRLFRSVSHMPNGTSGTILTDRRASNPRPLERGDSRVKCLIESIECATKQVRTGSLSSSTSSLASTSSETNNNNNNNTIKNNGPTLKRADTDGVIRNLPTPLMSLPQLKDGTTQSPSPLRTINCNTMNDPLTHTFPPTKTPNSNLPDNVKITQLSNDKSNKYNGYFGSSNSTEAINKPVSILASKIEPIRRNSYGQISTDKKDPLASLAQSGGSKRNALLKWCQMKTVDYCHVDITNFSSSWNDGMAFCAILDSYLPDRINYNTLNPNDKKRNFEVAISAAESVGISTTLDTNNMLTMERPGWQMVFNYVTSIYCHFET